MPVSWKTSTPDAHEALQKKHSSKVDPEWEALMDELVKGNTVMVEYKEPAERVGLARSIGRRAAYRGFKVDLRDGGGYLSVQRTEEKSEVAKGRKSR